MPATMFIGDLHFFHPKVSLIRGFATVEEHNQVIVRRWRKQVKEDTIVYVMGDVSGGGVEDELRALSLLLQLPGRKRLIAGNHDGVAGIHQRPSPNWGIFISVFESINDYGHINFEGHRILLSHYPYWASQDGPGRGHGRYQQARLPDHGLKLIHAHTHHTHPTDGSATGRELCVSWDAWKRLADMGDVAKWVRGMENA